MENNNFFSKSSSVNNNSSVVWDESTTSSLLNKVFIWMAIGLAITGITAYYIFDKNLIQAVQPYMIPLIIGELVLVGVLSMFVMKMSITMGTICFAGYSLLNGITLSPIFYVYTMHSISVAFFVSAITFFIMALIGFVTKKDLTKLGGILFIAVIGLLVTLGVNLFLKSSKLDYIASAVGVLIFAGLTLYDVNKLKNISNQIGTENTDISQKVALIGALTLYLDFINLFIMLLSIIGGRSKN